MKTREHGTLFLYLLIFAFVTATAVVLDVPVMRQLLAFLFFLFVPGLLLVYILRPGKFALHEVLVLSVGLSVAFLLISALIFNTVSRSVGYDRPLAPVTLLILYGALLTGMGLFAYFRRGDQFPVRPGDFRLDKREMWFLLVPAALPLLSIVGTRLMNTTGNSAIMVAVLLLIAAVVIIVSFWPNAPSRTYAPMLVLFSISILSMTMFRSPYILGSDSHQEYYLFQMTALNQHWQVWEGTILDTCLSISLLPAIFQNLMHMAPVYLFNLIINTLFALSPLVVYIIIRKKISERWAFLGAVFFLSQLRFFAFGGGRNDVAVFFTALLIMVIFAQELKPSHRTILFFIFSLLLIFSHYSATVVFFILLALTWTLKRIIHRVYRMKLPGRAMSPWREPPGHRDNISNVMILWYTITFYLWYAVLTQPVFPHIISVLQRSFEHLNQTFVSEMHGDAVTAALGFGLGSKDLSQQVQFAFSWLSIGFIAIGVIMALVRYRFNSNKGVNHGLRIGLAIEKFGLEFVAMGAGGSFIIFVAAVFPLVSRIYDMGRIYFQMMVILSTFFVIGGIALARFWRAKRAIFGVLAVLLVVIPFYLCSSGALYQLLDEPNRMILNSGGVEYKRFFIHQADAASIAWLREYGEPTTPINAFDISQDALISQGLYAKYRRTRLITMDVGAQTAGYVFLREVDLEPGGFADQSPETLARLSKIYTNGLSEVWD